MEAEDIIEVGKEEAGTTLPSSVTGFTVPSTTRHKVSDIPIQDLGNGITLEYVGKGRFGLIRFSDLHGFFNEYQEYFDNIRGSNHTDSGVWVFPLAQEVKLKQLIKDIMTGILPPPHLQRGAQAISLNLSAPTLGLLSTETESVSTSQIGGLAPLEESVPIKGRRSEVPPPPSVAPMKTNVSVYEMVRASVDPAQLLPSGPPAKPMKSLRYDPTERSPGESDTRYQMRLANYNSLIQRGLPIVTADLLSRMKENMEFEGVEYSQTGTGYVNNFLPKQ